MAFLEKHKVLSNHQFGFRKNNSTAFAVYDLVEHLMKNKDNDEYTCTFFLDLSKAFDTVNRQKLITILKEKDFEEGDISLIEILLNNTTLRIQRGRETVNPFKATIGVPRGDGFSPKLSRHIVEQMEATRHFGPIQVQENLEKSIYPC